MNRKCVTALLAGGLMFALSLGVEARPAAGQAADPSTKSQRDSASAEENWWKNAVIYEIYPRSFQDSNGDGVGDLNGITSRLDYLEKLGVDAIWLTPCYPSPQADFGYDISDYVAIDPQYGTMADFDKLVAEAKTHHIRVIMDMVMNHSSDKHQWFIESRSSRNNPKRNWYVWKDGKGETATSKGEPPNNWQSDFGHSAWEWDAKTRQYYYHKFYIQQPDFDWNNPAVMKAFDDISRFWLNKGVAGFRFDAITTLFEDPNWIDDKPLLDKDGKTFLNNYGDTALDDARTNNLPGVYPVMAHYRKVFDSVNPTMFPGRRVMIGETYVPTINDLLKMYGPADKPEFELPMDTQLGFINKLDIDTFRSKLNDVETKIGDNVPMLVFDNHDNPRIDARYGDGTHDTEITRVISTILFASKGASLFYYGAEIGMKTTPPTRKEDVKDPVGLTGWPKDKGRDGERTPMQWDDSEYAGFSTAKTWLPVPPNKAEINVKAEEADSNSLLHWYEQLIQLKKTNSSFKSGSTVMLDPSNKKVLSWLRKGPGKDEVVVAVNFTAEPQTVNLVSPDVRGKQAHTLLKSPGTADPGSLESVALPPFGVYIGEVK